MTKAKHLREDCAGFVAAVNDWVEEQKTNVIKVIYYNIYIYHLLKILAEVTVQNRI